MANSKYPLNGRYATLGDLVHEYALGSAWPTNKTSDASPDTNEFTEGWVIDDTRTNQPFTQMIFNDIGDNEYEAELPYALVWFGNVYAQDIYDPGTKMRKLVQVDDTSIYGFDRYIIASKISNSPEVFNKGIEFRFIIPDRISHSNLSNGDDQSRYFYNYKLDNGEATVIYMLQQIIDLLMNQKYWEPSDPNRAPTFDEKTKRLREFLFGQADHEGEIHTTEAGRTQEKVLKSLFYYNLWYDKESARPEDTDAAILEKDNQDRLFVKADSYNRLGSYWWTEMNVQYKNYTTEKVPSIIPTVNTRDVIDTDLSSVEFKNLKELIYYTISGTCVSYNPNESNIVKDQFDIDNIQKSYLVSTDYTKLYYYCYWFLMTQRFHRSYVTGCEFIKISNVTYLPNQPVLRCDLSIQRIIEEFKILAAKHTVDSMLPAGPITDNTPITINISYSAKYANIGKRTESSFEITLTFKQINQIKGNTSTNLMWIQFYLPDNGRQPDLNNSQMDGYPYGNEDYFPVITNPNAKNWSLKTIQWPVWDIHTNLPYKLLINKSQFEAAKNDINFENGNCYESTFNLRTYGETITPSEVANKIHNYLHDVDFNRNNSFAPGGMIRIRNCYTQISNQQAQASSYYLDVPLIRRKNYYYKKEYAPASDTNATRNIDVKMFFEPAYHDTNEARAFSSVSMNLFILGKNEHQPSSVSELEQYFANNDSENNLYPLTSNHSSPYYLTIKSRSGTMQYYVSGDSLFISNGLEPDFIHFSNIYVDKFFAAGQEWYIQNETDEDPFIENRPINVDYDPASTSGKETQTQLTLRTNQANSYNYYRMYFSEMDENEVFNNNYIYFKVNNYLNTDALSHSFTIRYLKPIDTKNIDYVPGISSMGTNEDVLLDKAEICFIVYHKDTLDRMNMSYTHLAFYSGSDVNNKLYYIKNNTDSDKDIIFKLSAIENKDGTIDRFIYSKFNSNGNPIYMAYTFRSSYNYKPVQTQNEYLLLRFVFTDSNKSNNNTNNNIFDPVKILTNSIYTHSACKVYVSLRPIYIFCFIGFQAPEGISNIQLNKLYYRRGSDEEQEFTYIPNVEESQYQGYMVSSFDNDTVVYMKPDSVTLKLNESIINLGDSTLYENYNVGLEYSLVGIDSNQQVIAHIGPTQTNTFTNMDQMNDGAPIGTNINYICYNLETPKIFQKNALNMIRVSIHPKP